MILCLPPISSSLILFSTFLETVSRAPITIDITVTFMFNNFFNSLALLLPNISSFFTFTLWFTGKAKSTWWEVFFLLIKTWSDFQSWNKWFIFIWKSQIVLCVSSSIRDYGLCICLSSNVILLHNIPIVAVLVFFLLIFAAVINFVLLFLRCFSNILLVASTQTSILASPLSSFLVK